MEYSKFPKGATLPATPFIAAIPEGELARLKSLISPATFGPETFENLQEDGKFGISHKWLSSAVRTWQRDYDW
jgi:microsomal epoxide hydrolase